jgi:hypothetical protein
LFFYHTHGTWEKALTTSHEEGDTQRPEILCGLVSRHLHHAEVFLRDQMAFHP